MKKNDYRQHAAAAFWARLMVVLLPVVLAMMPAPMWAADTNDDVVVIDGVSYHVLRNADDWERFRQLIYEADGQKDVNAIMDADFTVTQPATTGYRAQYCGIFNGNGHTLNVEIVDPYNNFYASPFYFAHNATFKDLHVTGSVSGGKHSSGLVGMVGQTAQNCKVTFERVWVSVTVTANDNPDNTGEYVGGFVGHLRKNSVELTDCRFDGKLISTHKKKDRIGGAFIGWGELSSTGKWVAHRLYENGSKENITKYNIGYYADDGTHHWYGSSESADIFAAYDIGGIDGQYKNITDQNDIVNRMAGYWQIVDGKAVPKIKHYPLDATFETYDIVPGTESGEEGLLKIPFSCDQVVKWIDAWYTDENGNRKDLGRLTLPPNSYSGFLTVPATEAHRDLQMNIKLMLDDMSHTYDAKSDAVMHNPRNIKCDVLNYSTASLTDAGAVRLQWETKDADYQDVVEGDAFAVLRSLTGRAEDMQTIGSVLVESGVANYEYKDSTLISALMAENIDAATGTAQVTYWVTRASAQQLWGMNAEKNPTMVTVQPSLTGLTLLQPTDLKADWSSKEDYMGKLTWSYKPSDDSHRYVWDDRVSMKLEIKTFNREDSLLQTTISDVTTAQIQAGEMEVPINHSCVNYQMALLVYSNKSPLCKDTVRFEVALPDDKFYHESLGRIDKESLAALQLQSSVLLTWADEDDEPVDYYEVWRRDVNGGQFERIAGKLSEKQYEDKTTSPVHQYEYFVRGVNDCEGFKHVDTKTVAAHCKQTGTVEGYLRFADGTGIPDVEINVTSDDNNLWKTKTDEFGFFRVSDLPYVDGTETTYTAAPSNGYSDMQPITFTTTPGGNLITGVIFIVEKSVKFSGIVQYDGTSIPVQGVSFLVDGREVHGSAGKVVSDHEGKFSFRMLEGEHSVQAVKEDHGFLQDGFYHADKDLSKIRYNFTGNKTDIHFYDTTRVKLIGRIAGGKDQGEIPLGNSLSRNNLGDDLQMVLTLEGDKASRLVWDIQNHDLKERDEVFKHKSHDKKYNYQTKVHTTLNRMVVTPDVHTGEYEVWLPPVKWKIQQITAKGYPTLFQSGSVGDVIDLSDSLKLHTDHYEGSWLNAEKAEVPSVDVEYHAQYSRIYHSPVVIDYKQIGYGDFEYFGDENYNYKNLRGDKQKLQLAYGVRKKGWPEGRKDSLETHYTFGYPVFSIDRKYPVKISATERYYYNNNEKSDTVDVVRLSGGSVTIHNGMVSSTHRDTVKLDSVGEATYILEAAQVPYLLTGRDALRTVTMTLEMDGTHYEAVPLRAYILNIQQMKGAKDVLSYSAPLLVDILRDPPGGASKATLSKGSTLMYSYQMDMNWSLGVDLSFAFGVQMSTFTGLVAAPMGAGGVAGFINGSKNSTSFSVDLVTSGSGSRAFNYIMTTAEDISTSSAATMVGADADIYIGVDQNIVVKPATAIRAIPDSVFQQVGGQLKAGRMVEIAQGTDGEGNLLHLVRDEVLTYGPVVNSDFVHSQHYITNQLLPSLAEQCLSLLFTGTREQAVERANQTGEPVYWSKVDKEHKDFGEEYEMIVPDGYTGQAINEVAHYKEIMLKWVEMIAQNEREKLSARDLVQSFDVDGGSTVTYGESFASEYSNTNSLVSPISGITDGYFDSTVGNVALNYAAIVGPVVAKMLAPLMQNKTGEDKGAATGSGSNVEVRAPGFDAKIEFKPILSYNVKPKNTELTSFSRKESFTIGMDRKSHLNFDVYRVETATDDVSDDGVMEVFVGSNFTEQADDNYEYLKRDLKLKHYRQPRSFVYRTRAGATCRPYEDERVSYFYNPGTVIDERTKKIENPIIKMDKQSISGVPFGEPARFKLYLSNESEQPEAAYNYYSLYQAEMSNPDGVKMLVDGTPLTGGGRTIEVRPGQVTEKTLEVYAGEKFDYKNLKVGIISQGDMTVFQEVAFDVHYLQTAGPVTISTPGDKWIMNCDAPQDGDKGWYMPVIISGFDKNQHNFDHIEFQYKESTRGDDYWTNLCGFYADSTIYAAASGTKEMIPENGNISTRFFGDGTIMEKAYDLRAVLFCRNGNSFLTHESKALSGVKDTRRPQLFGNPEPKDGVLKVGDNIIFQFSENIEYNYLQSSTNFEVKGEINETNIQEAPSLQFDGADYAYTQARRNFADKNITIEVMIRPENTGKDMPIFSHGRDGKQLQLWLTAKKHLRAVVDDKVIEGKGVLSTEAFKRVAMVLDNDAKKLMLYSDSLEATMDSVVYSGYGSLIFGATNQTDVSKRSFYQGRMLQGRVWNRAMDINLLNAYGNKLLTGYEMGLTDYYPMNEGKGNYATDFAQGAHLTLCGAEWVQPHGMSLQLDKTEQKAIKGLQLKPQFIQRTAEQDYTLMFWFKTTESGHGALLCNGSGRKTDVGAKDKFFIGFEGPTLKYRSNGREFALGNDFSDDRWHHYAMTVNRAHQVASIYVDNDMKAQFATDSLGGMTGDFYLGNMVWKEEGPNNDVIHQENPLTGLIDGIALFEQALPKTLIERYNAKALGGEERGLITYVDFERQELQKSGELLLQPYVLSKKVYYDLDNKPTDQQDYVFVDSVATIIARVDQTDGAPMQAYEELQKLNFSFVGRDHRLLVNIDELDASVNKRNVYVTVSEIPDLNGNFMASPVTAAVYFDLNPIRWSKKVHKATVHREKDADYTFNINVENTSGASHTYTITNLPKWLSVDEPTDVIDAKSEQRLTFTIGSDVNVGSYDDIIYVTDENGLAEPLALNITVEGEMPEWTVPNEMKQFSMSIVGRVEIENDIVTDSRDKVAVFDAKGRCMGVANISFDSQSSESLVYLSVYDSTTVASPLSFRLWHYETGKIMVLTTSQSVVFKPEGFVGTTQDPLLLQARDLYIQHMHLVPGWNWVSLNVQNSNYRDVKKLLDSFNWQEGDMLSDENQQISLLYQNGEWLSNKGTTSFEDMMVSVSESYRVKVSTPMVVEVTGTIIRTEGDRTIKVKHGWNSIGYTPLVNLPISTALSDYLDEVEEGDVLKSKTEFAMFSKGANGSREWKGNLKYMKPGEGYMLYRKRAGQTTFVYPFYEPNATFFEAAGSGAYAYSNNMTLTAAVEGIELLEGDRLIAFAGNEAVADEPLVVDDERQLFYLNIAGDAKAPLSFAIERDGDIIAATGEVMTYEANAISGSYNAPTKINFVSVDQPERHGWYTVQGIKLNKKPTQSGVYIFNGRKQVIK